MQTNGGQLIKHLRTKMGISQEELAQKLFMKRRTLSNVEQGTTKLSIIEFKTALEVLGYLTHDFWIAYLSVEEFEGYLQYMDMTHDLVNSANHEKLGKALTKIRQSPLAARHFFKPFITYMEVITDETMPDDEKLTALTNALGKTSDRLNYIEVLIVNEIALTHGRLEQQDKGVALLNNIVENIESFRVTIMQKRQILSKLRTDLATLLMEAGEYEKAAKVSKATLDIFKQAHNIRFGPIAAYTFGTSLHKMDKDNKDATRWLTIAYHAAKGLGQSNLANKIQKEYNIS